jgi:L-ascorbate metabolism protein UlaG (beta-lactamase superfamily)
MMNTESVFNRLIWLGHSSFRIEGAPVIYLDPFNLKSGVPAADLILISHPHSDHCSPEDIRKILKKQTKIITSPGCSLEGVVPSENLRVIKPGESLEFEKIRIEALPAYNRWKPFHLKKSGWNGYILEMEGVIIYFAGDTDRTGEMEHIRCDIALLPVSGIFTMNAKEAAKAALILKPSIAVPMHYGYRFGRLKDARLFAQLILKKNASIRPVLLPLH